MIESQVPSLSTYSSDIDLVFTMVFFIVGFWFLLAEGILFWLLYKFRANGGRAQYLDGTDPKHTKWLSRPHYLILVCDIVLIIFAVKVWVNVKQTLPPADETVRVVAQQWAWSFQHPGADNVLDTPDDIKTVDDLHVVAGKTYHFELISRDVLHSFSVPVFRLKQDVIPGRVIKGWFKPTKPGVFDIQCAEMCGIGHGVMGARIVIETPDQHARWLAAHTTVAAAPAAPAAPTSPPVTP